MYILMILIAVIIGGAVQYRVRSAFKKYSKIGSMRGMTGAQVARDILDRAGLSEVKVEGVKGNMTDHYDPRTKVVRLSEGVYQSSSLAAIGIAAHEVGHAVQHGNKYAPLMMRNTFAPVASFGSQLLWPAIIGGLFFHIMAFVWVGVIAYGIAVIFSLVTLPVEFDASKRAMALAKEGGYLSAEETTGAGKVLSAAAMTYVAATLVAIMQLLYFIGLARD